MSIQDKNDQQGYTAPGASANYTPGYDPVSGAAYDPAGTVPPPPPPPYPGFVPGPGMPHAPNPLLAGLLGFIPGVGAMYNGQFAKGLAHIAIFTIFVSLTNHVSDVFGIFIAGWVFYMAFEAYQTAMARRSGAPLPDPFGLNNIGERFGFHAQSHPDINRAWEQTVGRMPGAAPTMEETRYDAATGATYTTRTDAAGNTSTYQVDPAGNVYTQQTSGAAAPGYVPPASYPGYQPPPAGYAPPQGYQQPWDQPSAYGVPPVPPIPGYGMPPVPPPPPMPPLKPGRFGSLPTGAVWLIGLGFLALLGSWHPFSGLQGEATGGLFLLGLGAFMIYRRHNALSYVYPEGSPALQWSNIGAYRGASILILLGFLLVLKGVHVLRGDSFGAIFLIGLGIILFAERMTQNRVVSSYAAYPGVPPAPPQEPAADPSAPVSIVPKYTHPENDLSIRNDQEGR